MNRHITKVAIVLAAAALTAELAAADWPQFQGPDRNGISPETGLLREWPEGGPEVLWETAVGKGFAGPSVKDGKVYILERRGPKKAEKDVLRCLDLETGEDLWEFAYDAPGQLSYNGSRGTPTVDDERIYSVGPFGHMYCIDRRTHQPLWSCNLLQDFRGKRPNWGLSQSPSLHQDLAIVAAQGEAGVVAFRRATGEVAWTSRALKGGHSYVSPVVVTIAGVPQAVTSSSGKGDGETLGVSCRDGSVLWSYGGWQCGIPIPYPTPVGDDRLFITGEYGAGSAMIRILRNGGDFAVEEVFKTDACGSQIHQPLLLDGHLYMNSNGNKRRDGMLCLSLDGERKWRTADTRGLPTFERGGLLMADGLVFVIDGERGDLRLVEPSPEGYRELASVGILGGGTIWAPMALSDGRLIIRDQSTMKCLRVAAR